MIRNPFNSFLRAPVDDSGVIDDAGEGLSARMAAFLATPETPPEPAAPKPAKPVKAAASVPVALEVPVATPAAPVVPPVADPAAPAAEEEEEEEEFPVLGQPVTPTAPEPFDEVKFDAETAEEVKGMDVSQTTRWKLLKSKVKESEKAAAAARTALATAPVPAAVQTELETLRPIALEVEALRQRNQELLLANDQTAVREQPEFIAAVTKPIGEMTAILNTIATGSGLDPADLCAVVEEADIAKQDKMLDALQVTLGSRMVSRLERLSDDYKAILVKEAELLAEAPKTLARSAVARQQAQQAEAALRVGAFKAAVGETFTAYAARVPGFTDSSGAMTDLAISVRAKTEALDVASLAPSDLGFMAFCANSFPEARRALVALQKENALLRAGKPLPKPLGGNSSPPPAAPETGEPQGLAERMAGMEFTFSPPR